MFGAVSRIFAVAAAATNNMLTPLGYYEAYELVVVLSPRLSDLEKVCSVVVPWTGERYGSDAAVASTKS